MYKVFKRFKVPIGHRLSKHCGLCKNIHGHNLVIEVQLSTDNLNDNDMVIDFKDLKTYVNDILEKFDHTTILNRNDTESGKFLEKAGFRVEYINALDRDPTAEVFSAYLYKRFQSIFCKAPFYLKVDFVRVWENDDSMAEYSE